MAADPSLPNVPSAEPAPEAVGNTTPVPVSPPVTPPASVTPTPSAPPAPAQAPRVRSADMGQYIRTYAKDVARLTNQPIPATTSAPTAPSPDAGSLRRT